MRRSVGTYATMVRQMAKTNTAVKQYIEQMPGLDIVALTVQPWIKEGLKQIKQEHERADFEQSVIPHIQIKTLSSVDGDIRRWLGGREFLEIERGGMVEIEANKLLWFPVTGGFWYETIFSRVIPPSLKPTTQFVSRGRRLDYMTMYRAETNKHDALNAPIIDLTGQAPTTLTAGVPGVRISRL